MGLVANSVIIKYVRCVKNIAVLKSNYTGKRDVKKHICFSQIIKKNLLYADVSS